MILSAVGEWSHFDGLLTRAACARRPAEPASEVDDAMCSTCGLRRGDYRLRRADGVALVCYRCLREAIARAAARGATATWVPVPRRPLRIGERNSESTFAVRVYRAQIVARAALALPDARPSSTVWTTTVVKEAP